MKYTVKQFREAESHDGLLLVKKLTWKHDGFKYSLVFERGAANWGDVGFLPPRMEPIVWDQIVSIETE